MALVLVPAVALAARAPVVAAVAAVASGVDLLASRRRRLAAPLQALLAAAALVWGAAAYSDRRQPGALVDTALLLLAVGCLPAAYAAQRRWPELRWGACERLVLLQAVAASVALWARCVALDLLDALGVGSGAAEVASKSPRLPAAASPSSLAGDVSFVVCTLMGGCGAVLLLAWRLLRAHAKPAGELAAMATATTVVTHTGAAGGKPAVPPSIVVPEPASPRRTSAGLDGSTLVRRSPRLASRVPSSSDGEEGAAALPHARNTTRATVSGAAASSAGADARTAALFYACVAAVIACLEYPLLWAHLRAEPVRWVVGTFFYALDGDEASSASSGSSGWGGSSGAAHAPGLAAWWLVVLGSLLAFAPRHDEDEDGDATVASADVGKPRGSRPAGAGGGVGGRARRAGAAASSALRRVRLFSRGRWNLLLRKLFHAAAVAMFAPPLVLDAWLPATQQATARPHALFLALALAVAVKVMVLLELARALALPPAALSAAVQRYVARYTDRRDAGVFVITHLLLLVGCALPLWLSVLGGAGGDDRGRLHAPLPPPPLPLALPLAGVLSLGVGDAAAAVVGITATTLRVGHRWGDLVAVARGWWRRLVRCGRRRSSSEQPPPQSPTASWPGARKTVEGTVAFVATTAAVTALLQAAADARAPLRDGATDAHQLLRGWAVFLAAATAAAGVETFTATLDNLTLPLVAWLGLGVLEWAR